MRRRWPDGKVALETKATGAAEATATGSGAAAEQTLKKQASAEGLEDEEAEERTDGPAYPGWAFVVMAVGASGFALTPRLLFHAC